MATPLEIIRVYGDLIERQIFADDEFARSFHIYPTVWSLYVLPNRQPGHPGIATAEWLRFAERHYSCIVRCWMAYAARQEIHSLCRDSLDSTTPQQHLQLHRLLFDYFCSFGAAIDNMRYAFDAEPLRALREFEKIYARNDVQASLNWLYERRTQFIHKAVVPCFDQNGLLSLDAALFDEAETRWDSRRPLQISCVSDLCDFYWTSFVEEMLAAWSRLLDLLKTIHPASTKEIRFQSLLPVPLDWRSASPNWPHGWPNLPGPSG